MFKLSFLIDDEYDSNIAKAFVGMTERGDSEPNHYIDVSFWSREQYAQQWFKSLKKVNEVGKALIALSAQEAFDEDSYLECLFIWKKGDGYIVQRNMICPEDYKLPVTMETADSFIPAKSPGSDEGYYQVDLDQINTAIESLNHYLENCPDAHKLTYQSAW